SGPGFSATAGSLSIPAGGSTTLSSTYTPSGSGPQSDNATIVSDASNGNYLVLLRGVANNAPAFSPPLAASYALAAFAPFFLVASATDAEGDALSWSLSSVPSLTVGATFRNGNSTIVWLMVQSVGGESEFNMS